MPQAEGLADPDPAIQQQFCRAWAYETTPGRPGDLVARWLPLPPAVLLEVASLWQLTGEIAVLEQVTAELRAGTTGIAQFSSYPGSGRCSALSSSPRSATSPGSATTPACAHSWHPQDAIDAHAA